MAGTVGHHADIRWHACMCMLSVCMSKMQVMARKLIVLLIVVYATLPVNLGTVRSVLSIRKRSLHLQPEWYLILSALCGRIAAAESAEQDVTFVNEHNNHNQSRMIHTRMHTCMGVLAQQYGPLGTLVVTNTPCSAVGCLCERAI